jgi:hypothetical protein
VAITDQMRSSHRWPVSLRELGVTWVEEFRAIRPSRRQRSAQTAPTSPAKRQQNVDGRAATAIASRSGFNIALAKATNDPRVIGEAPAAGVLTKL